MHPPVPVIGAATAFEIEKFAGNIGRVNAAGILILYLVQAAFPAPVAQRLPLLSIEGLYRLFPEGGRAQLSEPTLQVLLLPTSGRLH